MCLLPVFALGYVLPVVLLAATHLPACDQPSETIPFPKLRIQVADLSRRLCTIEKRLLVVSLRPASVTNAARISSVGDGKFAFKTNQYALFTTDTCFKVVCCSCGV